MPEISESTPVPELLRLAREGQALEAGVLALADDITEIAADEQTVARADALHRAARHLRTLVADTTGEAK